MYAKGKFLSLSCLVLALLPSVVMAAQEQDKAGAALKAIDSTRAGAATTHTVIKPAGTKNSVTVRSARSNNMPMKFPPWPPRQSFNHNMLPPPPPGPYMSTALSNTPTKVPVSNRPVYLPPVMHSPPVMNEGAEPMAMFSPDRPWPGDRVRQWKPENGGYHYAGSAFPPQYPPVKENGYRPYQPALPPRFVRSPGRMHTRMPSSRHRYNGSAMMQPGMPPRFQPPAYPSAPLQPYHRSQTGY